MAEFSGQVAADAGLRMGDGEMPASLDRLNWSAVFWGSFWAIAYGAWGWVVTFLVLAGLSLTVGLSLRSAGLTSVALVASIVLRVVWTSLIIVMAYRANRHVWEHECRRVERESDQSVTRPAQTVAAYQASQHRWAAYGLGFLILADAYAVFSVRAPSLRLQSIVGDMVAAVVLAGLFIYERFVRRSAPQS